MTYKIAENVWFVGVKNPSLRVFDIIMRAEYGTSYNAYIVKGEKTALIECAHETYAGDFINNIKSVIGGEKLDYIIFNHTEPDHSGCLYRLLELYPEVTVVSSPAANKYLKDITNMDFGSRIVKNGDVLDLGGTELKFIQAPFLHWPDSMFTYLADRNMLFSCDFLGAHFCDNGIFDTEVKKPELYDGQFEYYYKCIFGPFKPYVLEGLNKIKDLKIDMVLPSHGPILTVSIADAVEKYRAWSTPAPAGDTKYIPVVYASAYGYTRRLAKAAAEALEKAGVKTALLDAVDVPAAEINAELEKSDGFLIGSNTINRDATKPIWDILAGIDAINTKKPVGVFGSYGWSGEAIEMVKTRLTQLKFNVIDEPVKVTFRPTEQDLERAAEYALRVAGK